MCTADSRCAQRVVWNRRLLVRQGVRWCDDLRAPQREVLFVSLTFSLSPQPQRAVLVVSLSLCLFVSLTIEKKCVSPSKRSSLCLFDFSPLPPTSTSSARCLFVSLSLCLFDK